MMYPAIFAKTKYAHVDTKRNQLEKDDITPPPGLFYRLDFARKWVRLFLQSYTAKQKKEKKRKVGNSFPGKIWSMYNIHIYIHT